MTYSLEKAAFNKAKIASVPSQSLKPQVEKQMKQRQARSAFPKTFTYEGYLLIRTQHSQFKRKYFVLSHNFLLCGERPYAEKLHACIALEGSNVRTKSTDMTFELTVHSGSSKKKKSNHKKIYFFRASSPKLCTVWTEYIERASSLSIKDIYRLRFNLGNSESQSAKVVAAKHRVTSAEYAIKILDKRKCEASLLQREIQILKQLSHPSIVELCDLFETRKYLYIVMEFCKGGELFDQIANLDGEHYSEVECCDIMNQLAAGVSYMHDQNIVHRDLKPENILCLHANSIKRVKIADFGISTVMITSDCISSSTKTKASLQTRVGTLSYTAPEILASRSYDERVDYWSLGVIMYILVCGYPPFYGENDYDISRSIMSEECEFDDEDWMHVSDSTKRLVERLLTKDPNHRANCKAILTNKWKVDVQVAGEKVKRGFSRARQKLKQTVLKRKFGRPSMDSSSRSTSTASVAAVNSNNNNSECVLQPRKFNRMVYRAQDTMSIQRRHGRRASNFTQRLNEEARENQIRSFEGIMGSKCDVHLSFFASKHRDSLFVRNDEDFESPHELKKKKKKNRRKKQQMSIVI